MPTKRLGNSSVRNLLGSKGCALIGPSAQKEKKQNRSGFPSLSVIRRISADYPGLSPRRRSDLRERHVE